MSTTQPPIIKSWNQTSQQKPKEGVVVNTKIDDGNGPRNYNTLFYRDNLWWLADGSMYVYYTPTHWSY